ncbi:hypothetical protein [Streptosporangium sp. LJ11]|uniref:hypothetical protein n=1 Tax=Streptosporangium sp. LJ11 TaxID=3436927 RepID=UPI003F7AD6C8
MSEVRRSSHRPSATASLSSASEYDRTTPFSPALGRAALTQSPGRAVSRTTVPSCGSSARIVRRAGTSTRTFPAAAPTRWKNGRAGPSPA